MSTKAPTIQLPHLVVQIDGVIQDPSSPTEPLAEVAEQALCTAHISDGVRCPERPTHIFFWPGRGEARQCTGHTRRAVHLADVMGFQLPVFRINEDMDAYEKMIERAALAAAGRVT